MTNALIRILGHTFSERPLLHNFPDVLVYQAAAGYIVCSSEPEAFQLGLNNLDRGILSFGEAMRSANFLAERRDPA